MRRGKIVILGTMDWNEDFEQFRACRVCQEDFDGQHDKSCPIPTLLKWSGASNPDNWKGFPLREYFDSIM